MINLYYSYYCELYKLYSMNEIAEYKGISKFKLMVISMLKKIKGIQIKVRKISGVAYYGNYKKNT